MGLMFCQACLSVCPNTMQLIQTTHYCQQSRITIPQCSKCKKCWWEIKANSKCEGCCRNVYTSIYTIPVLLIRAMELYELFFAERIISSPVTKASATANCLQIPKTRCSWQYKCSLAVPLLKFHAKLISSFVQSMLYNVGQFKVRLNNQKPKKNIQSKQQNVYCEQKWP